MDDPIGYAAVAILAIALTVSAAVFLKQLYTFVVNRFFPKGGES